jgi:hypothetical protein
LTRRERERERRNFLLLKQNLLAELKKGGEGLWRASIDTLRISNERILGEQGGDEKRMKPALSERERERGRNRCGKCRRSGELYWKDMATLELHWETLKRGSDGGRRARRVLTESSSFFCFFLFFFFFFFFFFFLVAPLLLSSASSFFLSLFLSFFLPAFVCFAEEAMAGGWVRAKTLAREKGERREKQDRSARFLYWVLSAVGLSDTEEEEEEEEEMKKK